MITCKSPWKVMQVAHELARRMLPLYSTKFSRRDFTLPQLFACLVLREHQKKSYRGIEALLRDAPHWGRKIGMRKTPDHNTLCRAFHAVMDLQRFERMLDVLARMMRSCRAGGIILAVDSTYFDTHHHSRHYEYRCRQNASKSRKIADRRRAAGVRKVPKLATSVDSATHLILAARTRVGMSGDAMDFAPLLRRSCARAPGISTVVADSGFDSHANHVTAREKLGVCCLIKANAGRPTTKRASSKYRQEMKETLSGSQKGKAFGRRSQSETVNSMIKRNLGDSLRARSSGARSMEQLLRVVTHNVMIIRYRQRVETEPVAASFQIVMAYLASSCPRRLPCPPCAAVLPTGSDHDKSAPPEDVAPVVASQKPKPLPTKTPAPSKNPPPIPTFANLKICKLLS